MRIFWDTLRMIVFHMHKAQHKPGRHQPTDTHAGLESAQVLNLLLSNPSKKVRVTFSAWLGYGTQLFDQTAV